MSKTLALPAREVPVLLDCDVLVVGAGTSGFAAAVAAARTGVDVALAERNHFPGGVSTSGLMCSISNYFVARDGTQVVTGLPVEFIDRLVAENGTMKGYLRPTQPQIPNDPEVAKRVMIKMLREAKVRTLYGSVLCDVLMDGETIKACIFQARDQTFAVTARQFVDASGDLSVIHRAGGQYEEKDDRSSLLNRMANVDIDKLIDWLEQHADSYSAEQDIPTSLEDTIKNWREYGVFHLPHGGGDNISVVKEALAGGDYPDRFGKHTTHITSFGLFSARCNRGTVIINSNWFWGDCYDVIAESEREEEGRLLAELQAEFLINHFPGFENSYLLETATEIGHRVSRTFKGKSTMSFDDFQDGKKFPDVIGLVTEVDRRTKPFGLLKKAGNIPLGILIGNQPPNAIVGSAKNPSVERPGMLRGQASCLVVGRGAGVAAAVAVKQGVAVNVVDVAGVQDELRKQDTLLEV
ncbi:FAD-dependent oxidoreductase [Candidatus Sumerlaeota bacterium]